MNFFTNYTVELSNTCDTKFTDEITDYITRFGSINIDTIRYMRCEKLENLEARIRSNTNVSEAIIKKHIIAIYEEYVYNLKLMLKDLETPKPKESNQKTLGNPIITMNPSFDQDTVPKLYQ